MPIPTDRGFVTLETGSAHDWTIRIYATRVGDRVSDLFAEYAGIGEPRITTTATFTRQGKTAVSDTAVDVFFSPAEGVVYVSDPARFPA